MKRIHERENWKMGRDGEEVHKDQRKKRKERNHEHVDDSDFFWHNTVLWVSLETCVNIVMAFAAQ
jgi:hypothetical protein